jgi:hypothetical protein
VEEAPALADRVLVLAAGRIGRGCGCAAARPQPAELTILRAPARRAWRRTGRNEMIRFITELRRAAPAASAGRERRGHPGPRLARLAAGLLPDEAYRRSDTHHPQAWAAVWKQQTGLSAGIILQAARDSLTTPAPVTPAVVSPEQPIADAFSAAGLLPGRADFASYSVTGFNSTAGGVS